MSFLIFGIDNNSLEGTLKGKAPSLVTNREYKELNNAANEIKKYFTDSYNMQRREAKAAAAPKTAVTCPHCGASTIPDANGCCEYCGGAV